MYAMRMAAFALGLMAAGSTGAVAQTATAPTTTGEVTQQMPTPGMGPGMMGGQGGQGAMMGGGRMMGGHGRMGGAPCAQDQAGPVTVDSVKQRMEAFLQRRGNPRLVVGEVKQQADGTILATVVTKKEGAVVNKFSIDPKTGKRTRIND